MFSRSPSVANSVLLNQDTKQLLKPSNKEILISKENNDKPKKLLVRLTKCAKCSIVGIYIISSIILVLSLALFIFGIVLKVNTNLDRFKTITLVDPTVTPSTAIQKMNFSYSTSPLDIIAIFSTFFGGSLLFISIGSIIAADARHKCLLGGMIVYICIILALTFTGLFFTMSYVNDEVTRLMNSVSSTILSDYGKTASVTEAMDFVQYYFSCCGIKTNSDILSNGTYPIPCCNSTQITQDATWIGNILTVQLPKLSGSRCTNTNKSPCYSVIIIWMQPLIIASIIVYFILEICELIFLIFLFQALKSKKNTAPILTSTTSSTIKLENLNNKDKTALISRKISVMSSKRKVYPQ